MEETLSVAISGTCLSLLLYENLKNDFTQEGFLIGELTHVEKKKITDNDQAQIHIHRTIKISGAVPCPLPHYFYNGAGHIQGEKIHSYLGDLTSKVVAWYKFRNNSSNFTFTFRERIIHKQLSAYFKIPLELFTCCLLMSEKSENKSTHSFRQSFVRFHHTLEELPLHIVNLSDSNNSYKSPEEVSGTFKNVISELDLDLRQSQGSSVITTIENALHEHTKQLVDKLAEAEKRLFELEKNVKEKYSSACNNNEITLEETITASNNEIQENEKPKDDNFVEDMEFTNVRRSRRKNNDKDFNNYAEVTKTRGTKTKSPIKGKRNNESSVKDNQITTRLRKKV